MSIFSPSLCCPACNKSIDKSTLKEKGTLKIYLKNQAFPCPHCEAKILYPEKFSTIISVGILVAVILAPLVEMWEIASINSQYLFIIGTIILVYGIFARKLIIAPSTTTPSTGE